MAVEVYHVAEAKFGGHVLAGAVLITLCGTDGDRPEGTLSGHKLRQGASGTLEFVAARAGRTANVRIGGVSVVRSAGPGCEFTYRPGAVSVEYADAGAPGSPAEERPAG